MSTRNIFNKSNFIAFFQTARKAPLSTLLYRSFHTIYEALKYSKWYQKQIPNMQELNQQRSTQFTYNPLISIVVPTYCTPITFLHEMIQSVQNQTYSNWELCIADASKDDTLLRTTLSDYHKQDNRISVRFLEKNEGISGNTNQALLMAQGDFIGLLDHDDILAPNALFEIVSALNQSPDIDVLYTDEDKIDVDSKTHYYPNFKPEFNQDLLRSCNYICHFFVVSQALYQKIGGFRKEYDGSQDYDFILRATSAAKNVHHINKILYHWRVHSGSVASDPGQKAYCYDAAKKALQYDLTAHNQSAHITDNSVISFYDYQYSLTQSCSITIILLQCNLDITKQLHTDNAYINHIEYLNCEDYKELDHLITNSHSDYIILLQNIKSIATDNWIELLIGNLMRKEIGISSGKIIYHNKIKNYGYTYQKASILPHLNRQPSFTQGYFNRANLQQNVSLIAPDCLAFRHKDYITLQGFDASYTDYPSMIWDYCLRCPAKKTIIPSLIMESQTRINDVPSQKLLSSWNSVFNQDDPLIKELPY